MKGWLTEKWFRKACVCVELLIEMQVRLNNAAIMGFKLVNRCPTGHHIYESIHVPAHLRFAPDVPGYEKNQCP